MSQFLIRQANPEDLNFILSTWLRNYRHGSNFAAPIRTSVYYEWHEKALKRILSRPGTEVKIACNPEDPYQIFGYLVTERFEPLPIVHYMYVKDMYRNMGIAKSLTFDLPEAFIYTHLTDSIYLWSKENPQCIYNPYLI